MTRHTILAACVAACIGLSLLVSPAAPAQTGDNAIKVLYRPTHTFAMDDLNAAVVKALSQPPFQLVSAPGPGVMILAIPSPVEVHRGETSGTTYSFTMTFSRDGNSLGNSSQGCNAAKLSDCTDQIVLDVKSAAGL